VLQWKLKTSMSAKADGSAMLPYAKSTILCSTLSIIIRQWVSVNSKLLHRPTNIDYLNDNAQTPLDRFVVDILYKQQIVTNW